MRYTGPPSRQKVYGTLSFLDEVDFSLEVLVLVNDRLPGNVVLLLDDRLALGEEPRVEGALHEVELRQDLLEDILLQLLDKRLRQLVLDLLDVFFCKRGGRIKLGLKLSNRVSGYAGVIRLM